MNFLKFQETTAWMNLFGNYDHWSVVPAYSSLKNPYIREEFKNG